MEVHVLSGGAAVGLVDAIRATYFARTGFNIEGTFGAVGAMKESLLMNQVCDVSILTASLIDELTIAGHLVQGSSAPLGRVRTGIAVRAGAPLPKINDGAALGRELRIAEAIYCPDPERATAGIHFVRVLQKLGIYSEVRPRLFSYPNGATAMLHLAKSGEKRAIGCTQITEIKYAHGVALVGPLPREFELATIYSAAVSTRASNPDLARHLVALLAGPESEAIRLGCGFEN